MIGVDTNVLVYAANLSDPHHDAARGLLLSALATRRVCAPWTVLYEFLRVVTHPRVLPTPWTTAAAWEFVSTLLRAPNFTPLSETVEHASAAGLALAEVSGNLVYDAHIAAVLKENGVREFWTYDRDFLRFDFLVVRDPLRDVLS